MPEKAEHVFLIMTYGHFHNEFFIKERLCTSFKNFVDNLLDPVTFLCEVDAFNCVGSPQNFS